MIARFRRTVASLLLSASVTLSACNNYGLVDKLENPGGGVDIPKPPAVYFFRIGNTIPGSNIKGTFATARDGADNQCILSRGGLTFPDNRCGRIRAVISLSTTDTIANMPDNYGVPTNMPINAPNNVVLAPDWNAQLAGAGSSLAPHVIAAGNNWWSFSAAGGGYDSFANCAGGTGSGNGRYALASDTGASWLSNNTQDCSSGAAYLLCICF